MWIWLYQFLSLLLFFPSVHLLGDLNFRDIVWPGGLSKSGTMLSQSEGQLLLDMMDDHGLEQMIHFPAHDKTPWTWFLPLYRVCFRIFTLQTHSWNCFSIFKTYYYIYKETSEDVVFISESYFETKRNDALSIEKEKYFNGHSDARSVQENLNLIASFVHDSVEKYPIKNK